MNSQRIPGFRWGLVLSAALFGDSLFAASEWKVPDRVSPGGADAISDPASTDPHLCVGPDGHVHLVWPVYLSIPGLRPRTPNLSVDAVGQPHVVWVERSGSTSMNLVRYTFRSLEKGWIQPERVSVTDRVGFYGEPQVSVLPAGEAVVVWADDQSMGNPEVFVNRRGSESGAGPQAAFGFETPQPLSTIDQYHSSDVRLAPMEGERVAALWLDRRREGYQAKLRIYDGETWSREAPVGGPVAEIFGLSLVSGGEFLHFIHGVTEGIAVQTADSFLYWNEPVILPVSDPLPSFCAGTLDGERILLAYRESVLGKGVLFAREFLSRKGEFAGIPSVVGEVRQDSLRMTLDVFPAGEPVLSWSDLSIASARDAVYYSEYREPSIPQFVRGDVDGMGLGLSDPISILEAMRRPHLRGPGLLKPSLLRRIYEHLVASRQPSSFAAIGQSPPLVGLRRSCVQGRVRAGAALAPIPSSAPNSLTRSRTRRATASISSRPGFRPSIGAESIGSPKLTRLREGVMTAAKTES